MSAKKLHLKELSYKFNNKAMVGSITKSREADVLKILHNAVRGGCRRNGRNTATKKNDLWSMGWESIALILWVLLAKLIGAI